MREWRSTQFLFHHLFGVKYLWDGSRLDPQSPCKEMPCQARHDDSIKYCIKFRFIWAVSISAVIMLNKNFYHVSICRFWLRNSSNAKLRHCSKKMWGSSGSSPQWQRFHCLRHSDQNALAKITPLRSCLRTKPTRSLSNPPRLIKSERFCSRWWSVASQVV